MLLEHISFYICQKGLAMYASFSLPCWSAGFASVYEKSAILIYITISTGYICPEITVKMVCKCIVNIVECEFKFEADRKSVV